MLFTDHRGLVAAPEAQAATERAAAARGDTEQAVAAVTGGDALAHGGGQRAQGPGRRDRHLCAPLPGAPLCLDGLDTEQIHP